MNSFAGQQRGVPWPELALAVALAAIPLLAGRFLPLIDLPQHLAISRALVGLWQGEASFTQHFVVDPWPQPYWLYYLLVGGLAQVLTVEWANAAVIFAYSLGISLGVRHLLVTFGRNPHWWLVSVPLAWTSSFFYGFMAYLVGIPLVIFGIAEMERCTGAPPEDTRARWRLGILSLLIYLAHARPSCGCCSPPPCSCSSAGGVPPPDSGHSSPWARPSPCLPRGCGGPLSPPRPTPPHRR